MSTNSITVYYHAASPPCRAVRVLADFHKCSDKVNWVLIDLWTRAQLAPEFLAVNPRHSLPTLKDESNGLVIFESTAIIQYLAEVFNWTGDYAIPSDVKGKWETINALHNVHNFSRRIATIALQNFYPAFFGQPLNTEAIKANVATVSTGLLVDFEAVLQRGNGTLVGTPTVVDVISWIDLLNISGAGFPQGDLNAHRVVNFDAFPLITKFMTEMNAKFFCEELWSAQRDFVKLAVEKLTNGYRIADEAVEPAAETPA